MPAFASWQVRDRWLTAETALEIKWCTGLGALMRSGMGRLL